MKKVWGTEKGADCSTNSTFRDTRFYWQKSFCSLGLTKTPTMLFCDTLIYQSRFNARLLIKDLFHKMPLKSKLKISCCPSSNIMRMNRAICVIPELARICWKTFPFFGRTSWKPWQEIVVNYNRWMGWPAKEVNSGITTLFLLLSGEK